MWRRSSVARSSASGDAGCGRGRAGSGPARRRSPRRPARPRPRRRSGARGRCPGSRRRAAGRAPRERRAGTGMPLPAAELLEEGAHQMRDVVLALAQGRQLDLHPLEPVVEVLAEAARRRSAPRGPGGSRRPAARPPGSAAGRRRASTSRSWSARRSRAWSEVGMSPISSRKRVPRSASSNLPGRRLRRPVATPPSMPNSSLSRSDSGSAAQLTAISAPSRPERWWRSLRDQLLAGAALAAHQHADAARRHPLDDLEHAAHRRRQGDDPAPARPPGRAAP